MKIEIDKIERECQICTPQRGAFCIYDIEEGCYGFPDLIAVAPAITEKERACGNIVVCPIQCGNGGYEMATPDTIHNYLSLATLRELIKGHMNVFEGDLEWSAELIIDDFQGHGTYIVKDAREYISKKAYLDDKELLEVEKEVKEYVEEFNKENNISDDNERKNPL